MFGDIIQPTHLLVILVVALVVLGPKRLPEVGRSLGKGLRDFRTAMSGIEEHTAGLLRDEPAAATHTPIPEPTLEAATPATSAHLAQVTQAAPSPAVMTVSSEPGAGDYAD